MPASRTVAAWGFTLIVFAALAALTAVNLSARPALAKAREAERHKNTLNVLAASLDELAEHPRDPDAARLAALSLSSLIYADQAEPYYAIARARGKLSQGDRHARALGLARSNHREEALAAYREILEYDPDDPLALQRASTLEWNAGELYRAFELASRLAKTEDGAIVGLTLQGTLHHEAGHSLEALPFYDEVLKRDPELRQLPIAESVFWKEFCADLLKQSRAPEALAHLESVADRLNDPVLYNLLGSAREAMGQIAGAEDAWRQANRLDPNASEPLTNLGRTAMQHDSLAESERLLRSSYRLDPNSYETNYLLGLVARRQGRLDESNRFLEQAREIRRRAAATASASETTTGGSKSTFPDQAAAKKP